MKKIISAILVGTMLLMLFAGCGDTEEVPSSSEPETSESEVATEPESVEAPVEETSETEPESVEAPVAETSETEAPVESVATDATLSAAA